MTSLQKISDLMAQHQLEAAAGALRKLVKQKSKDGVDWSAVMNVAGQLADQDAALAAAQNMRAQSPNDPARMISEIIALGSAAKHKEAIRLAQRLQQNPGVAADGYSLESFYQSRFGRREKALELARKALALNADHAHAWEQIALLGGYDDRDADIAAMLALEKRLSAPDQLIALYYALGRAFDHAGDTDKAFEYISKGAALRRGPQPFNMQAVSGYLDRLHATFSPEFVKQYENEGAGEGAIFILSTPRAGSTLIEQILATAPSVTPTGEHMILRHAALPVATMEPSDMQRAASFKQNDWRKMARNYFEGVRRRFGPGKAYTDKSLINFYYAGLIRILFPAARLIWLRRDPRDVVWSCFRSRINANQWAETVESTCGFVNLHNKACGRWAELFGDNMLALEYEQLVSAPDETAEKIFKHAGIEKPEAWRDFYKSDNPVATASLAQVREPLNDKGVGSWRRYEKHLAPVYDKCLS